MEVDGTVPWKTTLLYKQGVESTSMLVSGSVAFLGGTVSPPDRSNRGNKVSLYCPGKLREPYIYIYVIMNLIYKTLVLKLYN